MCFLSFVEVRVLGCLRSSHSFHKLPNAVRTPEVVDRMRQCKQESIFIQDPTFFLLLNRNIERFPHESGEENWNFPSSLVCLQSFCSSGVRAKLTSSCVSDVSLDK